MEKTTKILLKTKTLLNIANCALKFRETNTVMKLLKPIFNYQNHQGQKCIINLAYSQTLMSTCGDQLPVFI